MIERRAERYMMNNAPTDPGPSMPKAFGLIEMLVLLTLGLIIFSIMVPNYLEKKSRSNVSRVKSDHRRVGVALESYYVDFHSFPPLGPPATVLGEPNGAYVFSALTTPVAYVDNSFLFDPFALDEASVTTTTDGHALYRYLHLDPETDSTIRLLFSLPGLDISQEVQDAIGGLQYALFSVAPNGKPEFILELQPDLFEGFFTGDFLYDPTNGTFSSGDFIRGRPGDIAGPLGLGRFEK